MGAGRGEEEAAAFLSDQHLCSRPRRILNPLSTARDRTRVLMDTSRVRSPLSHGRNTLISISAATAQQDTLCEASFTQLRAQVSDSLNTRNHDEALVCVPFANVTLKMASKLLQVKSKAALTSIGKGPRERDGADASHLFVCSPGLQAQGKIPVWKGTGHRGQNQGTSRAKLDTLSNLNLKPQTVTSVPSLTPTRGQQRQLAYPGSGLTGSGGDRQDCILVVPPPRKASPSTARRLHWDQQRREAETCPTEPLLRPDEMGPPALAEGTAPAPRGGLLAGLRGTSSRSCQPASQCGGCRHPCHAGRDLRQSS